MKSKTKVIAVALLAAGAQLSALMLMFAITTIGLRVPQAHAQPAATKANIVVFWGDDIGQSTIRANVVKASSFLWEVAS